MTNNQSNILHYLECTERGNNTKTSDPGKETSHTLQLSNEMPPQEFSVASSESSESVLPELSPIDLKSSMFSLFQLVCVCVWAHVRDRVCLCDISVHM